MSQSSASKPSPGIPADPVANLGLSEGSRAFVSFLLFAHLFALVVAVFSNIPASGLERRLRRFPGVEAYLHVLNMDTSYRYQLTYAEALDTDHFVEADVTLADGTNQSVAYPEAGMWPGERARRYRNLGYAIATVQDNPESESEIPFGIAKHLLMTTKDAKSLEIRCRRHLLQSREDVASEDARRRDPFSDLYYQNVYTGTADLVAGTVILVKSATAIESAPAPDSRRTASPRAATNGS